MKQNEMVKRFKCPDCDYLSPAGYLVDEADCPWCKIPMIKGMYEQFKNRCERKEDYYIDAR